MKYIKYRLLCIVSVTLDGGLSVAQQNGLGRCGCVFFQLIVCRFGMTAVIHSDQRRESDAGTVPFVWCLLDLYDFVSPGE